MSMYEIMKELHENEVTKERASVLVFEVVSRVLLEYRTAMSLASLYDGDSSEYNNISKNTFGVVNEHTKALSLMKLLVSEYSDLVLTLESMELLMKNAQVDIISIIYDARKDFSKSPPQTYLIRNTVTGLVKIGKSINPNARVSMVECGSGAKLELLYVINKDLELTLHHNFSQYKKHREWFDDRDGKIVAYFKEASKQGVKQ